MAINEHSYLNRSLSSESPRPNAAYFRIVKSLLLLLRDKPGKHSLI